jgi:hypothetical protein
MPIGFAGRFLPSALSPCAAERNPGLALACEGCYGVKSVCRCKWGVLGSVWLSILAPRVIDGLWAWILRSHLVSRLIHRARI